MKPVFLAHSSLVKGKWKVIYFEGFLRTEMTWRGKVRALGGEVALYVGHGYTKSTQSNRLERVATWLIIKSKLH